MTISATLPTMPVTEAPPPSRLRHPARWGLAALLTGTAVLYLWGLSASGNANDFYAAAVQSGTKSWKAFFFGSLDQSNFITVDKPPLSLWPMEIAGRLFGFNSWTLLVPQALEGVAAVALLYATVRRWFGPAAGLIAGAVLAVTPVAVLMFRYDQPDALMTLLLVAAAYFVTRAIDERRLRWMMLAGAVMGLDFLAKGLQPFTVAPALALVFLVAANLSLRKRILHLLAAGGALSAGAGWWVLAVALWPASDRPYIGGSTDNSPLGLAFGYNGLGRITGDETGGGGGGAGGGFSGSTGLGRLFNSEMGTQISWLLPASLIMLVALIALTRQAPRTDRTRAAALLWGGWLVVTGLVLSYAGGIIHPYYTVELAPAIAALVGIGAVTLWRQRSMVAARVVLAAAVAATGFWSVELLGRSPDWNAWLRPALVVLTVAAVIALLVPNRRVAVAAAAAGLVVVTGASSAYALNTAATPHAGSTASAGPASTTGFGGGRGGTGGFGGARGGFGGGTGGTPPSGSGGAPPSGSGSTLPQGAPPSGGGAQGGDATANSALTSLLEKTTTRWAAATVGDQSATTLILASGKAVMAIGGWSGSDPAPTLAQFQAYVAAGDISYYISGGSGGGRGGNSEIESWVTSHYTATTVGGSTVYDLTKAAS